MFKDSNALYHTLGDAENAIKVQHDVQFFKINGLEIPFSPQWKKIVMNLSGGADSACLTYLLCKIITENNFDAKIDVITHVRCWTTRPWQQPIGLRVYNKLKEMFPNIVSQRYENFIAPELEHGVTGYIYEDPIYKTWHSGDQLSVQNFNRYMSYRYKFDAVFNATSKNPPIDFPKKMDNREKDAKDGDIRDLIICTDERFLCHPFRFVDKSWIVAQYYYFGIEDLLNLTRSCEGDVTHKNISPVVPDYKSYSPEMEIPECGTCFWCLEREWAKLVLNETLDKLKNE
jgi:hypothetical protein